MFQGIDKNADGIISKEASLACNSTLYDPVVSMWHRQELEAFCKDNMLDPEMFLLAFDALDAADGQAGEVRLYGHGMCVLRVLSQKCLAHRGS